MIRDVHPAEVSLSDGRLFTKSRVFLTNERIIVWRENHEKVAVKVLELKVKHTDARATRNTLGANERLEVFTDEVTISINKGAGCNCGSSLKALKSPISWSR